MRGPQGKNNALAHGAAFSSLAETSGTIVEGGSKVMASNHTIKQKTFVSLIHGELPNDHWEQKGINVNAETEVFASFCCRNLWFHILCSRLGTTLH